MSNIIKWLANLRQKIILNFLIREAIKELRKEGASQYQINLFLDRFVAEVKTKKRMITEEELDEIYKYVFADESTDKQ
jgi:hypothetical protein